MCEFPNCKINSLPGKPFCIGHQKQFGLTDLKQDKPIPKKSDKRKQDDKEYKKIVKEMMAVSDRCELKVKGVCTKKAEGLHHMKKRAGDLLLDKRYLKRSCNACNLWVELHPLEAIKMGLSLSKFN